MLHDVKVLPLGFLGAYGLPAAPYGRLTAVCHLLAAQNQGDKMRGGKQQPTGVLKHLSDHFIHIPSLSIPVGGYIA